MGKVLKVNDINHSIFEDKIVTKKYQVLLKICCICVVLFFCLEQPIKAVSKITPVSESSKLLAQGIENIKNHDYQQALDNLTQVINLDNTLGAVAYSNRCLVNLQLSRYKAAKLDCIAALQFNPNNKEAYLNRGLAEYRLGNYEQALAQYQEVIQRDKGDYRAYYNQGLTHFTLEKYDKALADYKQALQSNRLRVKTEKAIIYHDRALVHVKLNHIEEAIADLTESITLDNINEIGYYNRGCLYAQNRNYQAALADFTQVIRLNPQSALSYLNRGKVHYKIGLIQAAFKDLQIALSQLKEQNQMGTYRQTLMLINQLRQIIEQSNRSLIS